MPIGVACQCGQQFQAKDHLAGKMVRCPKCGQPLQIPNPSAGGGEMSLEQLMNLEASSPALGGPQGAPGMGAPGMGAPGGVPGQGFPAPGVPAPGFPGQAPGGLPGAAGTFQPGQAAYAPQPGQSGGGGGMGKGPIIALCAGGGVVVLMIVGMILWVVLDNDPPVAQGNGDGAPVATSDAGGGGSVPGGDTPGGDTPGGNTPTGNTPSGNTPTGINPDGNTSTGKFVVADLFSIGTPAGFKWANATTQTVQGVQVQVYMCTKANSPDNLVLTIEKRDVNGDAARRATVKGHVNAMSDVLRQIGVTNFRAEVPNLDSTIPDSVTATYTFNLPTGQARVATSTTMFRKYVYLLQVQAGTREEAVRLSSIGTSLKELSGNAPSGGGTDSPPTGGNDTVPLAINKYFEQTGPLRGLRPFVEKGKPAEDNPQAGFSWMCELLPYLGHESVYKKLNFEVDWERDPNRSAARTVIPQFINPAEEHDTWQGYPLDGMAVTHFVGMSGIETAGNDVAARYPRSDPRAGMFGYEEIAPREQVTDGLSQTIMVLGVSGKIAQPWIVGGGGTVRGAREPYFNPLSGFKMAGQNGTIALMADGSVRLVPETIDGKTFRAMCTIHGSDTVDVSGLELKPDFFKGK